MRKWMRRVRGAIGMGITWAAAWFGAGMLMLVTSLLLTGSTGADVPYPVGFGALGFIAGVSFSGVLGLVEGRRRFDEMSLPRFAGWGAAGGILLATAFVSLVSLIEGPSFFQNLVVLAPVFGGAGAACAAGTLAIARKASDSGTLEGVDPDTVGLTDSEMRDLLGGGGS